MELIDVSSWKGDEKYEIFPIGAREKQMLWSPIDQVHSLVKPNWPYLFKESISRYPDQFWTEIVAYIVAEHLSMDVPKALPAVRVDSDGQRYGALIKWFYDVDTEVFIHGEEFFKKLNAKFDDKLGTQHNLTDLNIICRAMSQHEALSDKPIDWLTDMFLYDSLIGNTDRHQVNWGFIFKQDSTSCLSPLFDNGTSLGHERFIDQVSKWDINKFNSYLMKGNHHLRFTRQDPKLRIGHMTSIEMLARRKSSKDRMLDKLSKFDLDSALEEIEKLTSIECDERFTKDRYRWIAKIITARHMKIIEILK
ncbi:MAG: hypothetical protein ACI9B7_000970 [Oleispira sp.]|jgi:hypothetical protein